MVYTSAGNDWDEDEDTDDQTSGAQDSSDDNDADTDEDSQDQTDTNDDGAQALTDAAPHEVEAHRNLIGDTLQHLSDRGVDVDKLAESAGVDSADVDELTHGDLAGLTQYIAQHHPEALQAVENRYPAAQGILGAITGGGGILGRLFGR